MVQVLEKHELENLVSLEEFITVVPEPEEILEVKVKQEVKEEPKKKSRLFRKHKKIIPIDNVKRNLTNLYTNRNFMR